MARTFSLPSYIGNEHKFLRVNATETGVEWAAGGGGGSISGSIDTNQVAFGSAADTISGTANFTYDPIGQVFQVSFGGNQGLLIDEAGGNYTIGAKGFGNNNYIQVSDETSATSIAQEGLTLLGDFMGVNNGTQILINSNTNVITSSGLWDVGGFRVTDAADPISAQDLTTKSYVDSFANGLSWKTGVMAATTTALPAVTYNNGSSGVGATLTANSAGVIVIDGYTPVLNDRLLIKNQATTLQNGIYSLTTLGTVSVPAVFTRVPDNDSTSEMASATVSVTNGGQANSAWTQTTVAPVIGTNPILWVNFLSATYASGSGLTLTGNVFSLDTAFANSWTVAQTFDSGNFKLQGSVSGLLTIEAASTTTAYTIKMPAVQGASSTFLSNDGAGNLSWSASGSGSGTVTSISAGTGITLSPTTITTTGSVTSNLSTGVLGGQSVIGGTASGNNLILSSTANATKGKIEFGTSAYNEATNALGLGTASPTSFLHLVAPVESGLTASTESIDVLFNLSRNVQYATGAVTNQRSFVISPRTLSFVGSSTVSNAATLTISGASVAGTNAAISENTALLIQSGSVGSGTADSYGVIVNAQTGATNGNFSGVFMGGNVGIGTLTPAAALDITGQSLVSSLAFPSLNIQQTWNTTGSPSAILLNVTNTASGNGANLINLQTGGGTPVTQFKVSKFGLASVVHLTGLSSTPAIAAGAGAGTSPTVTIFGDDLGGYITVTTGTLPTLSATIATITFNIAYAATPKMVHISPANVNSSALNGLGMIFVNQASITTTSFALTSGPTALTAATTYQWYYHVKQ